MHGGQSHYFSLGSLLFGVPFYLPAFLYLCPCTTDATSVIRWIALGIGQILKIETHIGFVLLGTSQSSLTSPHSQVTCPLTVALGDMLCFELNLKVHVIVTGYCRGLCPYHVIVTLSCRGRCPYHVIVTLSCRGLCPYHVIVTLSCRGRCPYHVIVTLSCRVLCPYHVIVTLSCRGRCLLMITLRLVPSSTQRQI